MKATSKSIMLGAMAVLCWSTVATAFKLALRQMSPFVMLIVASTTALLVFGAWISLRREWHELKNLSIKLWLRFAMMGLIMPVAYYLVLFQSYDYLPAQIAQPVNYTWPIILAVMLSIFGHRPIPAWKFGGMTVSLLGVALISVGGSMGGLDFSVPGLVLALGSAALWGLYWIVNDSMKDAVSETMSLFLTFFFGSVYLWLGTIYSPLPSLSAEAIFSGAYIGVFEMGLPFICFGLAIRTTDNPALINQMCYLAPLLSLFFVSTMLGEQILPSTYVGLSFIVGGLLFNELRARKAMA